MLQFFSFFWMELVISLESQEIHGTLLALINFSLSWWGAFHLCTFNTAHIYHKISTTHNSIRKKQESTMNEIKICIFSIFCNKNVEIMNKNCRKTCYFYRLLKHFTFTLPIAFSFQEDHRKMYDVPFI